MKIDTYLHQLWLAVSCILVAVSLFLPVGEFVGESGAWTTLTNFKIVAAEGGGKTALWALGVTLCMVLAVNLFELLLSGFRNFAMQKRLIILTSLLLVGYYLALAAYILIIKGDAAFSPKFPLALPLLALVLNVMSLSGVIRAEAKIILRASSFRLRD